MLRVTRNPEGSLWRAGFSLAPGIGPYPPRRLGSPQPARRPSGSFAPETRGFLSCSLPLRTHTRTRPETFAARQTRVSSVAMNLLFPPFKDASPPHTSHSTPAPGKARPSLGQVSLKCLPPPLAKRPANSAAALSRGPDGARGFWEGGRGVRWVGPAGSGSRPALEALVGAR